MKAFATILASGLFLAAPAFADSVTIQTNDNAGVAISPPVAVVPAPSVETRSYQSDKVQESDGGVQREQKRTTETVTPNGSSKKTTKIETDSE